MKVRDGLGVLLITHDRRVVEHMADEVTTIVDGVSSPEPTTPAAAARTTRAATEQGSGEVEEAELAGFDP